MYIVQCIVHIRVPLRIENVKMFKNTINLLYWMEIAIGKGKCCRKLRSIWHSCCCIEHIIVPTFSVSDVFYLFIFAFFQIDCAIPILLACMCFSWLWCGHSLCIVSVQRMRIQTVVIVCLFGLVWQLYARFFLICFLFWLEDGCFELHHCWNSCSNCCDVHICKLVSMVICYVYWNIY